MKNLPLIGRSFYGIGIAGIGILQFVYAAFRPMLLPYWPASFPAAGVPAYVAGAVLILAGAMIIFNKQGRTASLILGIFFFLLFLCFHVYYQLFLNPYVYELGVWTNALKELAFSGGAFIIATTFPKGKSPVPDKLLLILGKIFFSLMLIAFGIDHFLYTAYVIPLVPGWIPWHTFWAYFGAVALIGAGVCILLKIKISLVALLTGIMIFCWFVILHVPRAVAYPRMEQGNEITSVFQALAFSGIAFVIAGIYRNKSSWKI